MQATQQISKSPSTTEIALEARLAQLNAISPRNMIGLGQANDPRLTRLCQEFLKEKGLYTGEIDGKCGELTRQAIREFQATDPRLKVDGLLGVRTAAAMLGKELPPRPAARTKTRPASSSKYANLKPPNDFSRSDLQSSLVDAKLTKEQTSQSSTSPIDAKQAGKRGRTLFHVNVPFISQFDSSQVYGAGSAACYRAAQAMMHKVGISQPSSTIRRIQIARSEDRNGNINSFDKKASRVSVAFIDRELSSGKPVVVGTSHKDSSYNRDRLTDHYVVFTGKHVDSKGKVFYTAHDPSSKVASEGRDQRFYVSEQKDGSIALIKNGNIAVGNVLHRKQVVSMVVPNKAYS